MKTKKFLSSVLKFVLLAVVAAFLALHSINLFTFIFPADQSYLAWLGFGLTGFGSIVYLVMFLWEQATVLQRSVALAMAVICSIGEVLAAIFGMMIESWKKAGFTLAETDFQTMLLVIGALSIAHFFALIAYFAGDKIGELLADADGDGTPNFIDPDYQREQRNKKKVVRQPVVNMEGFSQDQIMELAKYAAEIEARNTVGQGSNGHKAVTDPTQRQR